MNDNSLFELHGASYVLDPRIISAHDNMVAINTALAVDLTGQVAAESIGHNMVGGAGGQLLFSIGANLSKGGRSIVVLHSTAVNESISRIVHELPTGTRVTVPQTLVDYVVTECGIASLRGKTRRQRALELVAIAHPDFRAELRKEAERLYWP